MLAHRIPLSTENESVNTVESRIGLKEGFGSTPGKLGKPLTLKCNLLSPQRGREPSAEIPSRVKSVKSPR